MLQAALLIGRGRELPLSVILTGVLGGLLAHGLIGLFVGPIVLALGYELFRAWLAGPGGAVAPSGGLRAGPGDTAPPSGSEHLSRGHKGSPTLICPALSWPQEPTPG